MQKLSRYQPIDTADRLNAERVSSFVRAQDRCFERALVEGHITGSAWVMSPDGHSVLLTYHRKLDRWLQLGGHADGDPDVTAVARRETEEESGLRDVTLVSPDIFDLDVHWIPERSGEPGHFHYDIRFAFRSATLEVTVSPESKELAWVPLDRLESYSREESLLRMRRKWRRR